jgi:hypothetical protein
VPLTGVPLWHHQGVARYKYIFDSMAKLKVLREVSVMICNVTSVDKQELEVAFRLTCKQEFHSSKAQRL